MGTFTSIYQIIDIMPIDVKTVLMPLLELIKMV